MFKDKKILGLITARGGSKGIPKKNIIDLAGKPLLAYIAEAARQSKYLDRLIISTDCPEIAKIAEQYGAEAPFLRPAELAKDNSTSMDAALHAVRWLEKTGQFFDILVLLQPTSPLTENNDIDKCIEQLVNHSTAKAIVSVARLDFPPPEFNVVLNKDNFISKPNGSTDFKVLRRQDIGSLYYFEGTVFISDIKTLKEKKIFYHNLTLGYVVPDYKALEVDRPVDLIVAEALIRAKQQKKL